VHSRKPLENAEISENKNEDQLTDLTLSADHRILGQQLDLFSINEEIGSGLVLWHPRGAMVRRVSGISGKKNI